MQDRKARFAWLARVGAAWKELWRGLVADPRSYAGCCVGIVEKPIWRA